MLPTSTPAQLLEISSALGSLSVNSLCRAMVEDKDSRVDFGMAEALAFGTLALHRGVGPPSVGAGTSRELQPSTIDSQLQQEELIGAPLSHDLFLMPRTLICHHADVSLVVSVVSGIPVMCTRLYTHIGNE